ncbi:MAG TPA: inositol 2-dehydrogenase [Burkholderiales bacterium]|nr:inositol 2-dehydrogenase [Burkholderiales bacterium]
MLRIAVIGAGRIGKIHAANVARHPRARLVAIVDPIAEAGRALAQQHGCAWKTQADALIAGDEIDAVVIASPSDTHIELIDQAAAAGKAILCEKPIGIHIGEVQRCLEHLAKHPVPMLLGFNRRFDPSAAALKRAAAEGAVGAIRQVIISSRDPAPPPLPALAATGGLFRDMTIHDFDMGRWLLGEEPVELWATASCLVDPQIASVYHDVDTAMIVMRTASGRQCHINNCRQASYGYDQRLEVFGSEGMIANDNLRPTTLRRFGAKGTEIRDPLLYFFLERYAQSYVLELDAFIESVLAQQPMPVTGEDGRRALLLANAALESAQTGKPVRVR